MTEPVRPNTVVTGTDTATGVSHTAVPPDIERISPLDPRERPIVFHARVSQLLNVRTFSLRATTPERVVSEPDTVLRFPERVAIEVV